MTADIELLEAMQAAAANQPMALWGEGRFVDWFRDTVLELVEDYASDLDIETVIATARAFYDGVIRPLDLPYIPAGIESVIDDAIWQVSEYAIRRALS